MNRTAILTTALLAATLTACGSSDDNATAPETSAAASTPPATASTPAAPTAPADEAAALKVAVAAYTDAYFAADTNTAYAALSTRCTGKIPKAQYEAVLAQAKTDYGPDHPATDVQADVSGNMARVTYKVKGLPKFDQKQQPWALEGGAWKYDAC